MTLLNKIQEVVDSPEPKRYMYNGNEKKLSRFLIKDTAAMAPREGFFYLKKYQNGGDPKFFFQIYPIFTCRF